MCLVAAVVVAAFGYGELEDLYWLQHRGEVAHATVLDEYGFRTARIEVRFVTRAGETITGETANYMDAEVGQTIDVVYDREDPSRMQAADWGFDYWIPAAIFGAGTVLFLALGLTRLWRRDDR